MPPSSEEEAEALASLGPGILDLLPQPHGLEDDEVQAVIQTAAVIGTDQAYAFLQRFTRSLPKRDAPRTELLTAWDHFNADQYARDILTPYKKTCVAVRNSAQRHALRLLQPISEISYRAAFTQDEVAEYLSPIHTKALRIHSGELLNNLRFLQNLSALREFSLTDAEQLTHIDDLAGLPLTDLSLVRLPQIFSLTALGSLPALTTLALYTHLPWQSLAEMPAPEGLTSLRLDESTDTAMIGLSKWQQLRELVTHKAPTPYEWAEITSLPNLTELFLSDYDLAQAAPLRSVTYLRLMPYRIGAQTGPIPDIFPNLERIFINCRDITTDSIDITPLACIDGLRISLSYTQRIIGLEEFPPDKVSLYPRPRTTSA